MVIGTALGWNNIQTIVLAIVLAFIFGYALTMRAGLKAGLTLSAALGVALAADTVSITIMEIIDNMAMYFIPGAMDAGLGNWLFWVSLAGALTLAFVVSLPVNRWLISKGLGHAKAHHIHHGKHGDTKEEHAITGHAHHV